MLFATAGCTVTWLDAVAGVARSDSAASSACDDASFINQWVALIKDTSLAYIVGVPEFTFLANQLNNRLLVYPAQNLLFVGLVYLLLCGALQWMGPMRCSSAASRHGRTGAKLCGNNLDSFAVQRVRYSHSHIGI